MLVTSQLLIQTAKIFYSYFDVHFVPPYLKKVPPSMRISIAELPLQLSA